MKIYISCATKHQDPFWIEENGDYYKSNRIYTYVVYEDTKLTGNGKIVYESYDLQDCADYIVQICNRYIKILDVDSHEYDLYSSVIEKYSSDDVPIMRSSDIDAFESAESSPAVQRGVKKVLKVLNIDISPDMFVYDDDYVDSARSSGVYRGFTSKSGAIVLHSNSSFETVIHEIGHYVHHRYFGNKRFAFPNDSTRSKYSHKDYLETFAETFKSFILHPDLDSTSIRYMYRILRDRNLLSNH